MPSLALVVQLDLECTTGSGVIYELEMSCHRCTTRKKKGGGSRENNISKVCMNQDDCYLNRLYIYSVHCTDY